MVVETIIVETMVVETIVVETMVVESMVVETMVFEMACYLLFIILKDFLNIYTQLFSADWLGSNKPVQSCVVVLGKIKFIQYFF